MSKYKRIDLTAVDRCNIAREFSDDEIAADGYLDTKAQDPLFLRKNKACYTADGTLTEYCLVNASCAPKWVALAVCLEEAIADGDAPVVFEIHGSTDDFATFTILDTLTISAGDEDYSIFNMEKACIGYTKAMVHVTGGAGKKMMVQVAPVKVMGT